jgi:glucose-1-phosphate thymidylyltransferase
MMDASNFIKIIEERQWIQVGSPDEVAYESGWISSTELQAIVKPMMKNEYGKYLMKLIK